MGSLALIAARDAGDDDRLCLVTLERGSINFNELQSLARNQFQLLMNKTLGANHIHYRSTFPNVK
jgi:hypothetical protein